MNGMSNEQKFEIQNQDIAFNFTLLDELIAQRIQNVEHLKIVHQHLAQMNDNSRLADLFFDFVQCYGVQGLTNETTAIQRLDKGYWKKLIEMFNFEKLVSIAELKNIRADINDLKTPEFTKENVENFIYNLWSDRYLIFARKVDSALQQLSDDYKNNVNHLFSGKIIVPNHPKTFSLLQNQCKQIDEIRQAIRQKMNYGQEFIPTHDLLQNWEMADLDWLDIDFDLMRIKKFKNNSLHIHFSEDLVTHFNEVLSHLHRNRLNQASLKTKSKPYKRERTFIEFPTCYLPTFKRILSQLPFIKDDQFTIPNTPEEDTLSALFHLDDLLSFDQAKKSLKSIQTIEITLKNIKAKELLWVLCDGGLTT